MSVEKEELEEKVKLMYQKVALNPFEDFHFETGRELAEKLGYPVSELDQIPTPAIDSFAGVGYYFDLANISEGEKVLDLGSGSGLDLFYAANKVGKTGKAFGVDMTIEQLDKARSLAEANGFENVEITNGYIEKLPFEDNSFDVVISNGVINLSVEKEKVFKEIHRVLMKGGKMVISDIVSETHMPDSITCDSTLWASCIGGAAQIDSYQTMIKKSGLKIISTRDNPQYVFLTKGAKGAMRDYGVKSCSILAEKNQI